jgi:hypothetical protein
MRDATHRRVTPPDGQSDAIVEWGIPDHGALHQLTGIKSRTLIIRGNEDLMIPTKLSHLMAGLIPDAQIRIYPVAAHGFPLQYPTEVAAEVNAFLANDDGERRPGALICTPVEAGRSWDTNLTSFFTHHGLPLLFAAVAIESFGIPVPGETARRRTGVLRLRAA